MPVLDAWPGLPPPGHRDHPGVDYGVATAARQRWHLAIRHFGLFGGPLAAATERLAHERTDEQYVCTNERPRRPAGARPGGSRRSRRSRPTTAGHGWSRPVTAVTAVTAGHGHGGRSERSTRKRHDPHGGMNERTDGSNGRLRRGHCPAAAGADRGAGTVTADMARTAGHCSHGLPRPNVPARGHDPRRHCDHGAQAYGPLWRCRC